MADRRHKRMLVDPMERIGLPIDDPDDTTMPENYADATFGPIPGELLEPADEVEAEIISPNVPVVPKLSDAALMRARSGEDVFLDIPPYSNWIAQSTSPQIVEPVGEKSIFSTLRAITQGARAEEPQSFLDKFMGRPAISGELPPPATPAIPDISERTPKESSKPTPKPKDIILDLGTGTAATRENLERAQAARSEGELVNRLGKASELIGSGISRTKPVAQGLFDENIKAASRPIQALEEQIALEKKDPNSPYSRGFREYLKRFGVEVGGDLSGEQGEKLVPWALQQYNQELHRQTQERIAKENREVRSALTRELMEAKTAKGKEAAATAEEKETNRRFAQANRLIAAGLASSRSAFGRAANIHRSAEAIEQLATAMEPDELDTRQIMEIARNLDAMLASGAPTISGTKKLIPVTMSGDMARITEYITSLPKGAGQGEFVKRMLETVDREKSLALKQMKREKQSILAGYSDLPDKDPQKWKTMMRIHDLPMDLFAESVGREEDKRSPSTEDEDKVNVINPKGKKVSIRRSDLDRALDSGYKQVR